MTNQLPVPYQDPIARLRDWKKYPQPTRTDPNENRISEAWFNYFNELGVQSLNTPQFQTAPVSYTGQTASLGTKSIAGSLRGGLYRVTMMAQVIIAAATSSSLTLSISWTDNGVTQAESSAAITGNTTATHGHFQYAMYIDTNTPITFSTTYASNAANQMTYDLYVTLESLNG